MSISTVEQHEEDHNVPQDVKCSTPSTSIHQTSDDRSACSEISDETMQLFGLEYDCKPDIAEVAGLTLEVNYGDLALASKTPTKRLPSLVRPSGFSNETSTPKQTWSQLLDHKAQKRPRPNIDLNPEIPVWCKGYDHDHVFDLGISIHTTSPFSPSNLLGASQRTLRPASLPTYSGRRRPFRALKQLLTRRKPTSKCIPQAVFLLDKAQSVQDCFHSSG